MLNNQNYNYNSVWFLSFDSNEQLTRPVCYYCYGFWLSYESRVPRILFLLDFYSRRVSFRFVVVVVDLLRKYNI